MSWTRRVLDANIRLSRATAARWHLRSDKALWMRFEREVDDCIRQQPEGATVLDLGGGRRCIYAAAVDPPGRVRLIAVDIDSNELALNTSVDETLVADVAEAIPCDDDSANLIISRALLEHVDGVPHAVEEMARVLAPDGVSLHLVPCRYSLFGIAARVLPFDHLLHLTHSAMPETIGQVEFPVVYDHCWPQALETAFTNAGFREVATEITYACPGYFEAVYPLFLLQAVYELVIRRLRVRRLAAYVYVRAVR